MTLTKLPASSVDPAAMGPVTLLASAPDQQGGESLRAMIAATAIRSARLSPGMTQILLEVQSSGAPAVPAGMRALFRPKL